LTVPATVQAQFTYTINSDSTNTVTVTGYSGGAGAVIIPTSINGLTVTRIGAGAFAGEQELIPNISLTNVVIPASVTGIGESAFAYCTRLAGITIPDNVTNIAAYTFWGDGSLTNVLVGNGMASIGFEAFE
jgi:hypothetical protein